MTSGGRKRSTLPYVPQVSVSSPAAWQAFDTAAVVAASGAGPFGPMPPGSTISTAIIAPRPRTSPITG